MNASTSTSSKKRYATKAKIKAMVEIARELGLDVGGIEVSPDGTIRVIESRAAPTAPAGAVTDFDRFESEL